MLLFCYGVLLNEKIWRNSAELRIEPSFQRRAFLDGYQLIFDGQSKFRHGATANIKEYPGKLVWGALFLISDSDLALLDKYEGVPDNYQRKEISVKDDLGQTYKAWVYFRDSKKNNRPSGSYLRDLVEGAKACGLPQDYIQNLQKIKVCENAP